MSFTEIWSYYIRNICEEQCQCNGFIIISLTARGYYFNRSDDSDGEIELSGMNKNLRKRLLERGLKGENCDENLGCMSLIKNGFNVKKV